MIFFSFIVPVYNVSEYLDDCVESILGQTYPNLELILIDDGSTDGSGQQCEDWAFKDSRVRVIHQENAGLSASRNRGIEAARGDYCVFLDSDDLWLKRELLQKIADRLGLSQAEVLCLNYCKMVDGITGAPYFQGIDGMSAYSSSGQTVQYLRDHDLWIACAWNKIIHRRLFEAHELKFIQGITSEDIDWCVRLALAANRFDYMADPVIGYRQRSNSISKAMTSEKVRCLLQNIRKSLSLVQQGPGGKAVLLYSYLGYQTGTLLQNIAFLDDSGDRRRICREAAPVLELLRHGTGKKIKLLHLATRFAGPEFSVALLRIRSFLNLL